MRQYNSIALISIFNLGLLVFHMFNSLCDTFNQL